MSCSTLDLLGDLCLPLKLYFISMTSIDLLTSAHAVLEKKCIYFQNLFLL